MIRVRLRRLFSAEDELKSELKSLSSSFELLDMFKLVALVVLVGSRVAVGLVCIASIGETQGEATTGLAAAAAAAADCESISGSRS